MCASPPAAMPAVGIETDGSLPSTAQRPGSAPAIRAPWCNRKVSPNVIPGEFIAKWHASELKERSAAQEHFIDLCRLLGEPTPAEADPTGDHYCFERGAAKDSGGGGWADVWKRHCFAWEY